MKTEEEIRLAYVGNLWASGEAERLGDDQTKECTDIAAQVLGWCLGFEVHEGIQVALDTAVRIGKGSSGERAKVN